MNLVAINGSHRKESNSELLLDYVLKNVKSNFSIDKINLADVNLECVGCKKCHADAFIHSDLTEIYSKMLQADIIIFSTPTYFGMPSALMKILMDRSNALWLERKLKGKIGAAITNGAGTFGGIELNAKAILHYFHDNEMISVPFYSCFNESKQHDDERYPKELPKKFVKPLDKLCSEIVSLAKHF